MPRSASTGRFIRSRRRGPSQAALFRKAERVGDELAGVVSGPTVTLGGEPERETRKAKSSSSASSSES